MNRIFGFTILLCSTKWSNAINKDIDRDIEQIIHNRGFNCENHRVITGDEYILTMYRIVNPYRNNTLKPVMMQSGELSNAKEWLTNSHGKIFSDGIYYERNGIDIANCNAGLNDSTGVQTLPFLLASCGYDVWMVNSRSSRYSGGHLHLEIFSRKYWNFSFQEMGIYDNPAFIDYILEYTQKKSIAIIGISLSSISTFITLMVRPEYGRVINPAILTAPAIYPKYLIHEVNILPWIALRNALPLVPIIRKILQLYSGPIPANLILFSLELIIKLTLNINAEVFKDNHIDLLSFSNIILPLYGDTNKTFTEILSLTADDESILVADHLIQWMTSNEYKFQDFGSKKNMIRYGTKNAPQFYPENIICPNIALIYGDSDIFVDSKSLNALIKRLNVPLLDYYLIPVKGWRHGDYQYHIKLNTALHPRILFLLKNSL